jgi:hypothetical protein
VNRPMGFMLNGTLIGNVWALKLCKRCKNIALG